jgi:hypothetical protein
LPVNGPLEHVRCASCFAVNPVPMLMFEQVFQIFQGDRQELAEGETRSQTPLGAGGIYRLTWGAFPPKCPDCGTTLPETGADQGPIQCPICEVRCSNAPPSELFSRLYPTVKQIVLADQETLAEEGAGQRVSVDQSEEKPVVLSCEHCGGSLTIAADVPRLHDCQYCGAKVWIPDDLWGRLHPTESTRGWTVRFQGVVADVAEPLSDQMDERYDAESLALDRKGGVNKEGPSRWARLQIHTNCPACEHPIPINGPLPHVVCPACGTVKDILTEAIGNYMAWVGESRPIFDGLAIWSGERFQMKCSRASAYCTRCDTDLPPVEPGTDGTIECPGCAATYTTFPVPELFQPHAAPARQVYCGQRHPDPAPEDVPTALAFSCPSCGAEQTLAATAGRVHECAFCDANVFIPDELWSQLHPVAKVHPWFVDTGVEPPPPKKKDEIADEEAAGEDVPLDDAPLEELTRRLQTPVVKTRPLIFVALGIAIIIMLMVILIFTNC